MGTVDDRVGALEVRVGEHAVMLDGLREGIASLDRRIGSLNGFGAGGSRGRGGRRGG